MEVLLSKLKKVKGELEALKAKPTKLDTKISEATNKYTTLISATELKTEIDGKFTLGKTEVDTFIDKFISQKKDELIYEKPDTA